MFESTPAYELRIDLNALNHLGLNLYSNVPAVLSELIANAWDADSSQVNLDIDTAYSDKKVIVRDDGCGMSKADINNKFLTVGYQRRIEKKDDKTEHGRTVMGRKGIGKLSVFSIADFVEVYTRTNGGQTLGLILDVKAIRADIENGRAHHPQPIENIDSEFEIASKSGTTIVLSKLKKRVQSSIEKNLRKRIARRFNVWSEKFRVIVNDEEVKFSDREYYDKLEYALIYDGCDQSHFQHLKDSKRLNKRDNFVNGEIQSQVKGWIGLVQESGQLKEEDENLNKLAILVRGKIASEDILDSFGEGGLYTKYLIGELEADFLDDSDQEDIATSSRQDFLQDDQRFINLRKFISDELKFLRNERSRYKMEEGVKRAKEIPEIREWLNNLRGDARNSAQKLLGKINVIETDEKRRRILYQHAVLAFEYLHYKEKLNEIENLRVENLEEFLKLLAELDEIEASRYYQITHGRLEVVEMLAQHIKDKAFERVIQEHIYNHLWLLDPSWDRATETPAMEETIKLKLDKISSKSNNKEITGRIDIRYKKCSGKHIVIELKKPDLKTSTTKLIEQVNKYIEAVNQEIELAGDEGAVEAICLVGTDLIDWNLSKTAKEKSRESLAAYNIRVITYQQLVQNAQVSYRNYLEQAKEISRIAKVVDAIEAFSE